MMDIYGNTSYLWRFAQIIGVMEVWYYIIKLQQPFKDILKLKEALRMSFMVLVEARDCRRYIRTARTPIQEQVLWDRRYLDVAKKRLMYRLSVERSESVPEPVWEFRPFIHINDNHHLQL